MTAQEKCRNFNIHVISPRIDYVFRGRYSVSVTLPEGEYCLRNGFATYGEAMDMAEKICHSDNFNAEFVKINPQIFAKI